MKGPLRDGEEDFGEHDFQEREVEIVRLPLEKIEMGERPKFDMEKIADLAWSIRKNGLIQLPGVIKEKKGAYRLISGVRRIMAIRYGIEQGWGWYQNGIPCVVTLIAQPLEKDQELLLIYESNIRNRDDGLLSLLSQHRMESIKELYHEYLFENRFHKTYNEDFVEQLAEILRFDSNRHAYKLLALARKAPDWMIKAIDEGSMCASHAMKLVSMSGEKIDHARKEFEKNGKLSKDFLKKLDIPEQKNTKQEFDSLKR